jgi:hypothetical protein
MDGVTFDIIIRFVELGGKETFPTLLLSIKLVKTVCLNALIKDKKSEIRIKKKNIQRKQAKV